MQNKSIYAALVAFQNDVPKIELDSQVNAGFKFKYASLKEIMSKIKPILAKNGLFVNTAIVNKQISVQILHTSGEGITYDSGIEIPVNADPKKVGAFITYMKRYTLVAALGLVADEDKDAPPMEAEPQPNRTRKRAIKRLSELTTPEEMQKVIPNIEKLGISDEFSDRLDKLMETANETDLAKYNAMLDGML